VGPYNPETCEAPYSGEGYCILPYEDIHVMGEHICGEVESLFIGSAVSLCASILMFVLWMVAVICICRHNNMKWKKKKKFLYIAIPAWISVTSEPFFLYGFAKFFTVKTYLAPYDI
jgi:hypothetical protein